ncbi:hypothetical protein NEUTE1DRAFT_102245 [Neurospora tetrasperma FGSC 2508]|uniref:Uncharacterized protein n=1 Tax=Neurospora tetrasperma (strain FGSC 2508 / ATCC MYA-4615 / P0657) TaxID=510951 RepID=F8MNM4_NEUT8|nr:uncharacterized protein NEUTE1DRAFT_102245 [Neurospora tetrasperma FGSC 2508]EGO56992.1 hypothetical protein NEUTE1DRAFT_102245 [Neurospora tetrasperma FGSC 2508]EGZ70106.1 hypothetical protein NEUTE2DRAFT_130128 [Neurospora tetrasperma FGSC 2509]
MTLDLAVAVREMLKDAFHPGQFTVARCVLSSRFTKPRLHYRQYCDPADAYGRLPGFFSGGTKMSPNVRQRADMFAGIDASIFKDRQPAKGVAGSGHVPFVQ